MTGRRIVIGKGYKVNAQGKLVPQLQPHDVSAKLRQRTSKRVRVKRRGAL